jgi:uncharacterized protein (TIGR02466 family)
MIIPLFSSPLYQAIIPTSIDYNSTCNQLDYNRSGGDNGWISTDQQVLNKFPSLQSHIDHHLHAYIHDELKIKQEYYVINSWINKHDKGDYLPIHSHANSIFTGIYYITLPPHSGEILSLHQSPFVPSFVPGTIIPDVYEYNVYNSKQCDIKLEEGTLLLFPSHIEHSAQQSNSNYTRYALSFNVFLRGSFGSSTAYLNL